MILTVDIETYYNTKDKYSLGSMTPEEYIRDDRYQLIGASVKQDDHPTEVMSCREAGFWDWFLSFPWSESICVAHNGHGFDFQALSLRHNMSFGLMADTLVLARCQQVPGRGNSLAAVAKHLGLGEKGTEVVRANGLRLEDFSEEQLQQYMEYCRQDTTLCYGIFQALKHTFTEDQYLTGHLFASMATDPQFVLDQGILEEGYHREVERKRNLTDDVAEKLGLTHDQMRKIIMSNPKFAEALRTMGVEPPMKISPRTEKPTYAFSKKDQGLQDLREHHNEMVRDLVDLRLGTKTSILETRLARFIGIAKRGGTLPVALRLHGALVTGRASGAGARQNLQNLSKHGVSNNALRESMRAPESMLVMAADSSQVEVRVLGDITGEPAIIEPFTRGADPYKAFGYKLYGHDGPEGVTPDERQVSKSAVLAAGFGQGPNGFQLYCQGMGIDVTEETAVKTIKSYRKEHPVVVKFWEDCDRALKAVLRGDTMRFGNGDMFKTMRDGVLLPSGRKLLYPDLQWSDEWDSYVYWACDHRSWRRIYGRKICQNLTQALAYDVIAWQMCELHRRTGWKPALQVHDEIVLIRPEEELMRVEETLLDVMRTRPPFLNEVVLDAEFGAGRSYAEV